MPPLVVDVMDAQRAALLRGEEAALREMARRWLQVEQQLQAQMDALTLELAGRTGPLTGGQLARLQRYQELQAQIDAQLAQYAAYVEADVRRRQLDAGLQAVEGSSLALQATAAESGISAGFNRLPTSAVERMVGLAGDGSPLRDVLTSAGRVGPDALAAELVRGVALGLNPREIARRAMRQGLATSFTRMATIARTEVLRVARKATLDNYRQSGVCRGWRRLAAKNERTCLACLALDGEEYDLEDDFDQHVNCRCTLIPVLKNRPPLKLQTGQEWFEAQPEATQRRMMGPARYELWQSGKLGWGDLYTIHEDDRWGNSPQVTPVKSLPGGAQALKKQAKQPPPPVAPVRTFKPNGTPVSGALTGPKKGIIRNAMDETLAAIDGVHGDGSLPTIPVKPTSGEYRMGAYRREFSATGKARSVDIGVSTKGERKELTLAHEIGHFLDYEQIGIARQVTGVIYGTPIEPEVANVVQALRSSRAAQRIGDLMAGRDQLRYANDATKTYGADFKYCQYLRSDIELWARGYAQYIAVRSKNPSMLESVKKAVDGAASGAAYPSQWEDDDFAPIAKAIDELFLSKGWLE